MSGRRCLLARPAPTFAQLCVLTHYVFERLGPEAVPSDSVDELKWDLARAGFDYPDPQQLTAAVEAVKSARAKGYSTPRVARRRAS